MSELLTTLTTKGLFDAISKTSLTTIKSDIIRNNKDEEEFVYCLKFLADTQIVTGLSSKKMNKKLNINRHTKQFSNTIELLEYVKENNTGTDEIITNVQYYISQQDISLREFLFGLVTKSIKLGANVKLINRAIPNLIYEHNVMLASKFEGELKGNVSVSLKLDGIRASAIIENGKVIFKSRQGKEILGLNEISNDLLEMITDDYFIDGELLAHNTDNVDSKDLFRKTTKIVSSNSLDKKGLKFVMFDILPLEEYYSKTCKNTFFDRRKLLDFLMTHITINSNNLEVVPNYGCTNDIDYIYNKLDEVVSDGLEGLMLNYDKPYEFKRSKNILKVKKFNEGDVLVTELLEGEGRLEGTLGKIKIQFNHNGKTYNSTVGSGFSDNERTLYWNNKELLQNKIVTISYFELTNNQKDDTINLRFPTWKSIIRTDKTTLEETNLD